MRRPSTEDAVFVVNGDAVAELDPAAVASLRLDRDRLHAAPAGVFLPPPWAGVGVRTPVPRGAADDDPVVAVRAVLPRPERAALLCTGTPADLVLLHHAAAVCPDLLVLVPERRGPGGISGATTLTPSLARLAAGCDVLVLEPEVLHRAARLAWRPAAPAVRPSELALPAAVLAAERHGARVLLTTTGVAEVVCWPPKPAGDRTWHRVVSRAAAASGLPARIALPRAIAPSVRLTAQQPWFGRDGRRLPDVVVPMLDPAVVTAACGAPGGFGDRVAAVTAMMPAELREWLPVDEPFPVGGPPSVAEWLSAVGR